MKCSFTDSFRFVKIRGLGGDLPQIWLAPRETRSAEHGWKRRRKHERTVWCQAWLDVAYYTQTLHWRNVRELLNQMAFKDSVIHHRSFTMEGFHPAWLEGFRERSNCQLLFGVCNFLAQRKRQKTSAASPQEFFAKKIKRRKRLLFQEI